MGVKFGIYYQLRRKKDKGINRRKRKRISFKNKRASKLLQVCPHCYWCGRILSAEEASVEHIHPRSEGGTDHPENIGLSCRRYNSARKDGAEFCQEPNSKAGRKPAAGARRDGS